MFDGEGLRQTEDKSALQVGTGGLVLAAAEDNIIIVQTRPGQLGPEFSELHDAPNIEVLGIAGAPAATKEAESHLTV